MKFERRWTHSGHCSTAVGRHHWLYLSSLRRCLPQLLDEGGKESKLRNSFNEG
jgi:hypothetical protein